MIPKLKNYVFGLEPTLAWLPRRPNLPPGHFAEVCLSTTRLGGTVPPERQSLIDEGYIDLSRGSRETC